MLIIFEATWTKEWLLLRGWIPLLPMPTTITRVVLQIFRGEVSQNLWIFNNCQNSYQAAYPSEAPQDLKDAVNLARKGTIKVIAGLTSINSGLTSFNSEVTNVSYSNGISRYCCQ